MQGQSLYTDRSKGKSIKEKIYHTIICRMSHKTPEANQDKRNWKTLISMAGENIKSMICQEL